MSDGAAPPDRLTASQPKTGTDLSDLARRPGEQTGAGDREATDDGHQKLWLWFGLSRAAFLTLPRVLMHEMPDEWQGKMADLLDEYDATFRNLPDLGSTVRATRQGRIVPMPEVFKNYRHPNRSEVEALR